MSSSRRDFIKGMSASALVLASHDLIGDLLAQTPPGRVLQSKFKGLADLALAEAKAAGCSYADIRFTRSMGLPGVSASATNGGAPADAAGAGGRGAGGGRGGGGGGGRGGGGGFGGRGGGGGGERT